MVTIGLLGDDLFDVTVGDGSGLPAPEFPLACNPRRLTCPVPGTPDPHSTGHRAVALVRADGDG